MHRALIIFAVVAFIILSVMTVASQMNPSEPAFDVGEGPVSEEWTEPVSAVDETGVETDEDVAQPLAETANEAAMQVQESAESVRSITEELASSGQEAAPTGQ